MPDDRTDTHPSFLSTLPARPIDRRLALAAVGVSTLLFAAAAPFAKVLLPEIWAFIPFYQSALTVNDLITAALLFAQYGILRSRALLLLGAGYLFTAIMAFVHALTFPGLLAPGGLLGAGPQTTAWLYMFWHGVFPLAVIGYALLKSMRAEPRQPADGATASIVLAILAAGAAALAVSLLPTAGHELLPPIMRGNNYTPAMFGVVTAVWALSVAALAVLWLRKPHSVLDLWLMVVMCAWIFDIALAAVLNAGRFDLGFYAGRIYGLLAATFVLVVLLLETGLLYAQLARLFVSEQRQAADTISKINARLQALLDSSPMPIFSLDVDGRLSTWNRAAERIFGYGEAELSGRTLAPLLEGSADGAAHHDQERRRVMAGENPPELRGVWRHKSGRMLDVLYVAAPIRAGSEITGAVYVAEDVTEKRKLENQLAQSQRMEAVGQLTGGIAHDFNNLLTVVMGNLDIQLEMLRGSREHDSEIERLGSNALTAAMRGAELVRRLLAFSRRQPLAPRAIQLDRLMSEFEPLLRRTLGEQITIRIAVDGNAWPVMADPSQVDSALLNLAINARDAMPAGGVLTISAANVNFDPMAAALSDLRAGEYVCISVGDTGTGIAPEVLPRVFDPFFTTKEVGKGSGMGLSMVYGFARQSGGSATIYSEFGRGTEVRIYLPRSAAGVEPVRTGPRETPASAGSERILVVEDQAEIRQVAAHLLQSLGYEIEVTETAESALAALDSSARFDLLFTDVIMPGGMSGIELAREVHRRHPQMAIVFTSGFSNPDTTMAQVAALGASMIGKPYDKAKLAEHLHAALQGGRAKRPVETTSRVAE